MRLLARAALVPLLAAFLVGCGSADDSDGDSTDSEATSQATDSTDTGDDTGDTAPPETQAPAMGGDYPTDASVKEYCAAFKGEDPDFGEDDTVADMVSFLREGAERIVKVGIPEDFTAAQRDAFDQQLVAAKAALAALAQRDQSAPVASLRDDKDLAEVMSGLDTPQPLRDYSAANC